MKKAAAAFDPYVPQDADVARSIRDLTDQLNQLNRNEFTIAVPCGDILPEYATIVPAELPSTWSRTILRAGWAPFYGGLVLRRTRLVKGESCAKTAVAGRGVTVRALIQTGDTATPCGAFSTFEWALDSGTARVISGRADINKPIAPGSVLASEVTYRGWPRQPFVDASILFDIAVTAGV